MFNIMFIYVPVISLPNTEKNTKLGRISHVIADNKCSFMNTAFTENVM